MDGPELQDLIYRVQLIPETDIFVVKTLQFPIQTSLQTVIVIYFTQVGKSFEKGILELH